MACEKLRRCLLFAFQLRKSTVETTEMVFARRERCIYQRFKDLREILIWKTTIVHRESLTAVSQRNRRREKKIDRKIRNQAISIASGTIGQSCA